MSICDISFSLPRGIRFQVTPSLKSASAPWSLVIQETKSRAYRFTGKQRGDYRYCVFQYTLSGAGILEVKGVKNRVGAGQGFLTDIQDPYYSYYFPEDSQEPWVFLYIQLLGDSTHMIVNEMVRHFGYIYSLDRNGTIIDQYLKWLEAGHVDVMSAADAMETVNGLLTGLMRSASLKNESEKGIPQLRNALGLLSRYPERPWNASIMAQELGVSREHLSRLFKTHIGRSPYEYILDYRIQCAAQIIREGSMTIKEVAYQYGFSSPETFSKMFKRVMGTSPREHTRVNSEAEYFKI